MEYNSTITFYRDINLDSNYSNICDHVNMNTLAPYQVVQYTNLRFIKHSLRNGSVQLEANYSTLLGCNYLSFNNGGYTNKIFYAFIDNISYISDKNVEVEFTIDLMSTYWTDWSRNACYVIRDHIAHDDDVVGSNRVPESLPFQYDHEYFCDDYTDIDTVPYGAYMGMSEKFDSDFSSPDFLINEDGILQAFQRYGGDIRDSDIIAEMQLTYDGYVLNNKADDLISFQIYPLLDESVSVAVDMPTTVGGYLPRNKKLLQYPFIKLVATNNINDSAEFKYEDFSNTSLVDPTILHSARFNFKVCKTGSPAVLAIPRNHQGLIDNYDAILMMTGYPQIPCRADSYTAFLGNQAVNLTLKGLTSISGGAVAGAATGGAVGAVAGAATGLLNTAGTVASTLYEAARLPDRMHGASGGNYAAYKARMFKFRFEQQSINTAMAERVDDFFTRYGYQANEIREPNFESRDYFNYVQTADDVAFGNVPAPILADINAAFKRGLTIWHNLSYVGDYSVAVDN